MRALALVLLTGCYATLTPVPPPRDACLDSPYPRIECEERYVWYPGHYHRGRWVPGGYMRRPGHWGYR